MRNFINIVENKLSFSDAKMVLADIENAKGRIKEIVLRNSWLVELSQQEISKEFGNSISVYRGVTVTDKFRAEEIVSTSLDWKIAWNILNSAPGMISRGNEWINTTSTLLHYKITPQNVVVYIPYILQFVRNAVGKRTNHTIEDRHDNKMKLAYILNWLDENDEQEIIADVKNIVPKTLTFSSRVSDRERFHGFNDFMMGFGPGTDEFKEFVA